MESKREPRRIKMGGGIKKNENMGRNDKVR